MFILTGSFDRRGITTKIIMAATTVIILEAAMLSVVNMIAHYTAFAIGLYAIALGPVPIVLHRLMQDRVQKPKSRQELVQG
jgi:hypothetical protein